MSRMATSGSPHGYFSRLLDVRLANDPTLQSIIRKPLPHRIGTAVVDCLGLDLLMSSKFTASGQWIPPVYYV